MIFHIVFQINYNMTSKTGSDLLKEMLQQKKQYQEKIKLKNLKTYVECFENVEKATQFFSDNIDTIMKSQMPPDYDSTSSDATPQPPRDIVREDIESNISKICEDIHLLVCENMQPFNKETLLSYIGHMDYNFRKYRDAKKQSYGNNGDPLQYICAKTLQRNIESLKSGVSIDGVIGAITYIDTYLQYMDKAIKDYYGYVTLYYSRFLKKYELLKCYIDEYYRL